MSESSVIPHNNESPPEGGDERRCPALIALAIAWLRPATVGGQTGHISLRYAFLLHLLGAIVSAVLIAYVVAAFSAVVAGGSTSIRISAAWLELVDNLADEFHRRPYDVFFAVAGVTFLVEVAFVAVAALVTPWGARDEPIRGSYTHALRQTWLHTTHVIPIVLLFGSATVTLLTHESAWLTSHPAPERPAFTGQLTVSPSDPGYAEAQKAYDAAMQRYREEREAWLPVFRKWQRSQPWYARYREPVQFHVGFALGLWLLWSLLRGVGAARRVQRIQRPPMCEFCGYNLTSMLMESRCPECGEPIAASLGTDVRPGTAWQHRRDVGRLKAWRQSIVRAVREPTWLGRQIRIRDGNADHRSFLSLNLPLLFLLGTAGMLFGVVASGEVDELLRWPEVFAIVAPMFGYITTLVGLGVTLFAALVVGAYYSRIEHRNLLAGSMRVAAYMAGYVLLSALLAMLFGTAIIVLGIDGWLEYFEELTGLHDRYIGVMLWLLPMVALGIGYLWLVARGTAALRYANK